jgi:AraC-like DNA-binding protein
VDSGGEQAVITPGDTCLYPVGTPLRVQWGDLDTMLCALPLDRVAQAAAEQSGISPARLRFESMLPLSAAMNRFWRATMELLSQQLTAPDTPLVSPLVEQASLSMAAAAMLVTFPNTTMTQAYRPGPGQAGTAALRRAVLFIEEHAAEPVTLTEIAGAARVTGRALQYAFARQYGTSPMGYLRRTRLEQAHRELRAADPAAELTVAAVARRWGWASSGQFAAAYRRAYGRPPSQTLRS